MRDDLFFVDMLAQALAQPDAKKTLCEAFERIERMGREPRYFVGHIQFRRFIQETLKKFEKNLPEGMDRAPHVEIILEKDGQIVGRCVLGRKPSHTVSIREVTPGIFKLKLDTGLILWEGEIGRADVLWAEAHKEHPLDMAADTAGETDRPTREIRLENFGLMLRLHAGIESGRLDIQRIDRGTKDR